MESMAICSEQSTKVYVIMRVYNLMGSSVGLNILIDPLRFRGIQLHRVSSETFYIGRKSGTVNCKLLSSTHSTKLATLA